MSVVGLPGLEPGTFGPPDRRANQAAPQPVSGASLRRPRRDLGPVSGPAPIAGVSGRDEPADALVQAVPEVDRDPPASSLRCHGIGGSPPPRSARSGRADVAPRPRRPAARTSGHVPSGVTVDGERNRSQSVHQGTSALRPAGRRGGGRSPRGDGCARAQSRRTSSSRRSSGCTTASTTSSAARCTRSTSSSYSRRLLGDERGPLVGIFDRVDPVVEHRVHRRLGTHHRDLRGRQREARVGIERRPAHRVQARAVRLAHDHRELRHRRLARPR